MKGQFIFPGVFSPPTYGHFAIVKEAIKILSEITIVCSTNKEKDKTRWFSEKECVDMWQYYDLPCNVKVATFAQALGKFDFSKVVMIRGVRCEDDMEHERQVMKINKERFGINKIFYIWAKDDCVAVSATKTRRATCNLDFQALASYVAPGIVSILIERELNAKNVFMVVGRPGCGKSTFLKMMSDVSSQNIWIDTDECSREIRPILHAAFGKNTDLVKLVSEDDSEVTEVIAKEWFNSLKKRLRQVPENSNIFLEVPYGLRPGKNMYKYLGNKIIYVHCDDDISHKRLDRRNTPKHKLLTRAIPDLQESRNICEREKLDLRVVNTNCSFDELRKRVIDFCESVK